MSIKQKLRGLILAGAIGLALLAGAPMRPDQIEDLLHQLSQPKVAHVLRDESDGRDDPSQTRDILGP